ncbi:MAG: hypothetical protein PWQ68_1081, partial [Thermoanaerobacteraceae bacterium]|nr:hypothetical protein [Thermoanaerobacteraceae bacterium]
YNLDLYDYFAIIKIVKLICAEVAQW